MNYYEKHISRQNKWLINAGWEWWKITLIDQYRLECSNICRIGCVRGFFLFVSKGRLIKIILLWNTWKHAQGIVIHFCSNACPFLFFSTWFRWPEASLFHSQDQPYFTSVMCERLRVQFSIFEKTISFENDVILHIKVTYFFTYFSCIYATAIKKRWKKKSDGSW